MAEIRDEHLADPTPFVISGSIGPQGDGYSPDEILSADAAQEYHSTQINTFADTEADMVTAMTMTYADEAIGIARAAQAAEMPVVALVHGRDRRPPADRPGPAARRSRRSTPPPTATPAYFMINCAHPTHFDDVLEPGEPLGRAHPRHPRERLDHEPRRARRGRGARRRRSRAISAPATRRYASSCPP